MFQFTSYTMNALATIHWQILAVEELETPVSVVTALQSVASLYSAGMQDLIWCFPEFSCALKDGPFSPFRRRSICYSMSLQRLTNLVHAQYHNGFFPCSSRHGLLLLIIRSPQPRRAPFLMWREGYKDLHVDSLKYTHGCDHKVLYRY